MKRTAITLLAVLGLALPPSLAGAIPASPELDPAVPAREATENEVSSSPNMRFVKNIPYVNPPTASSGSDIEFGEFTVTVLDEEGNPVCETDEAGECLVDEEGNPIYRTEQRDFAFAGSQDKGIFIFDITDPEDAFLAHKINCLVNQADIQVRVDLGLLGIGVDSSTGQCGLGGTQGVLLFDVTDPRSPSQLGVYKHARGAHNVTFHPTQPLMYLSDSDVASAGLGEIPIVDISDPTDPTLVTTFAFHAHSPHDVTFNAAGTRAYTSSISHSDILDTTDPRNPVLISTITDPSINIHHQSDPTPDGNTLVISDELAGAAAGPQCPGGGLHFYDISNETQPVKLGVYFAQNTKSLQSLCTAHVFRINPGGKTLVMGWYSGGTRIVDISDPTGLGAVEIGHMIPSGLGGNSLVANSWASKEYKGYIYSNDRNRGLDIMQRLAGTPAAPAGTDAVVAVVDTGINPYHKQFRDDSERAYQHPSTYIEGYPEDAIRFDLNLDDPDYWAAVRSDCEEWRQVENGKLYWFPGTKIIGGVSVGNIAGMGACTAQQPAGGKILDTGGHGTMTASRTAGNTYGACRECRVVAVQFPTSIPLINPASSTGPAVQAIRFAADNAAWIDAQSNSWGPFAPLWDPTGTAGLLTANPEIVRAVEETAQKHAAFWASGNGAAFRGGVAGHPTLLAPHMTPSAIIVGGMDSGYVNTWPGFPPHVISDSCDSWAAQHRTTTGENGSVGGGTSGATPFAAGGAARILMEARGILGDTRTGVEDDVVAEGPAGLVASGPLADGELTLAEWKDLVFKTATARPVRQFEDGNVCDQPLDAPYNTTPLKWASLPKDVPAVLYIGYGAVDDQSQRRAFQVLHAERDMPDRTVEDAYFTADKAAREVLLNVWGVGQ